MGSYLFRSIWYSISKTPVWYAWFVLFVLACFTLAGRWEKLPGKTEKRKLIFLATLLFGLADWLSLTALPLLKLSFGPVGLPLLGITAVRFLCYLGWYCLLSSSLNTIPLFKAHQKFFRGLVLLGLINIGITICELDGLYIEPFNLQITRVPLAAPVPLKEGTLRIVQLSDLHLERITERERQIVKEIRKLKPDMIVITGDFINTSYLGDPLAARDVLWLLNNMQAPYGSYAVTAETADLPVVVKKLARNSQVVFLDDELIKLEFGQGSLYLLGVTYRRLERDKKILETLAKQIPDNAYSLLLYHTPDLIEAAARAGISLQLSGHTHGGQIRVPLFGALVTASHYYKKYETGQYTVQGTALYVSRGLGLEGLGAPRARFLCPPEIVVIDIN